MRGAGGGAEAHTRGTPVTLTGPHQSHRGRAAIATVLVMMKKAPVPIQLRAAATTVRVMMLKAPVPAITPSQVMV